MHPSTTPEPHLPHLQPLVAKPGKYLVITLGGESYGIPVLAVREIIRLCPITPVANMPPHVRGVINLRGKIIPLVDLRTRFHLPTTDEHDRNCIVVTQLGGTAGGSRLYGVVVDGVEEVASFGASDIEPTPDFGGAIDVRFITGMAKSGHLVRTLIDLDRIAAADLVTAAVAQTSVHQALTPQALPQQDSP